MGFLLPKTTKVVFATLTASLCINNVSTKCEHDERSESSWVIKK